MGRGDQKSRRGKISVGSNGVTRPTHKKKLAAKKSKVTDTKKAKA